MSLYKERIGYLNQFSLVVFVLRMKGGNRTNSRYWENDKFLHESIPIKHFRRN